jgi:hypothetical protein
MRSAKGPTHLGANRTSGKDGDTCSIKWHAKWARFAWIVRVDRSRVWKFSARYFDSHKFAYDSINILSCHSINKIKVLDLPTL